MGLIQTIEDKTFAANIKSIARTLEGSKDINWEQRRYEIAVACLAAEMASSSHNYQNKEDNVASAIEYADLLIQALRKKV